jgi:magnesium chelatase family protein
MNPCPCGEGVYVGRCRCTLAARARYRRRISAPLLDRFDLVVPLWRPAPYELLYGQAGDASAVVAERVAQARARAAARRSAGEDEIRLSTKAAAALEEKLRSGELSARGLGKVSGVARTLADLSDEADVSFANVSEALMLRAGRRIVTT